MLPGEGARAVAKQVADPVVSVSGGAVLRQQIAPRVIGVAIQNRTQRCAFSRGLRQTPRMVSAFYGFASLVSERLQTVVRLPLWKFLNSLSVE